jgi:copper chaperone CopZ
MRMVFFVSGLTCQECADKLEAHIQRQPGVNAAALMVTGKFVIECDEDKATAIEQEVLTSAPKAQGDVKAKRVQRGVAWRRISMERSSVTS